MSEESQLLETVQKIHALLELLAEDKIAQRDAKQRAALREIVGGSAKMHKSVLMMDGTRTQKEIRAISLAQQSHLSALVGKLYKAKLLAGDTKSPKLVISIPSNFFVTDDETE